MLWDLNEQDRSMWIGVYDDGKRFARFGKWRFGEVDMEYWRRSLLDRGNVMCMQINLLLMTSMVHNPLVDFVIAEEIISIVNEFYEIFEEIKLNLKK
jgi:hypothetical protein